LSTTQPAARHTARPQVTATTPATTEGHRRLGLALVLIATAQLMVVLDATIVNVALPHIQRALNFSGTGLEWVVNAYALTFGGLLLLGGRAGDLLGRRRVFIAGIILFSAASLAGGFATSQAWLLAARALQGVGAAITAPAALSLVTTNFPEGPPRNRAFAVYSAMSVAGGAVGLMAGGLLTTYASWRWVLFVNVPIGIVVALAAPRVLAESDRQRGRFDLPGAITATLGLALLVYGLSNAATDQHGVSHWADTKVVASLAAAVVLLTSFVIIEARSEHALLPLRLLRNRNRSGAYVIMLCLATAMFGMFFFLTIFVQTVMGYSALKTGVAYLPMVTMLMVGAGTSAQLVPKIGARPLMLAGSAIASGGMFWMSRLTEHSSYAGGLLGPMMVTALGMGFLFMPISLVALSRVGPQDAGVASSLLNTGQQVGGSIGLAVLGTVAWTAVANSVRSQAAAAAAAAAKAGHQVHAAAGASLPTSIYNHALSVGFSRGFLVSSAIALAGLVITAAVIRVKRADLAGAGQQQPVAATPETALTGAENRSGGPAVEGIMERAEPVSS
jgi:EmrB/QacA subfamily drug resistance transporter